MEIGLVNVAMKNKLLMSHHYPNNTLYLQMCMQNWELSYNLTLLVFAYLPLSKHDKLICKHVCIVVGSLSVIYVLHFQHMFLQICPFRWSLILSNRICSVKWGKVFLFPNNFYFLAHRKCKNFKKHQHESRIPNINFSVHQFVCIGMIHISCCKST